MHASPLQTIVILFTPIGLSTVETSDNRQQKTDFTGSIVYCLSSVVYRLNSILTLFFFPFPGIGKRYGLYSLSEGLGYCIFGQHF